MSSNRNIGLDLVRAFAILFVLSVHFFLNTKFYSTPLLGKNMYFQVFMRMAFLICVPLFIILTGYLQINKVPEKKYYKKIIPILVVYLFYSILAIIVRTYFFHETKSPLEWVTMILNFKADSYSWYINMYIGLFLISPYLNIIYKNLSSKKEKKILILVFIFLTAVPTFFNYKARGVLFFPDFWSSIYPITYYFIGSYIREFQLKIKKVAGISLLIFIGLLETFIEVHYSRGGIFKGMSGYYSSLLIVFHAVTFFVTFYDINFKTKLFSKVISLVSLLSLDIYLASNITDRFVYKYVLENLFQTQHQIIYLSIPIVLTTFLMAFVISFIRHKVIRLR